MANRNLPIYFVILIIISIIISAIRDESVGAAMGKVKAPYDRGKRV